MSLQAWQLEAQKKFKEFKRAQKLIGEQIDFNYTVNTYEEHWNLTPIGSADDVPFERYRLFAGRYICKVELPSKQICDLNAPISAVVEHKNKRASFPEFPHKPPFPTIPAHSDKRAFIDRYTDLREKHGLLDAMSILYDEFVRP